MENGTDTIKNRKSFANVVNRFVDNTSMQGVGYIKNSKRRTAKIIWTFLLLAALGAMTLHIYYLLDNFLQYPKKTELTLGFSNLHLPAITFCNVNTFLFSKLNLIDHPELKRIVQKADPSQYKSSSSQTVDEGSGGNFTNVNTTDYVGDSGVPGDPGDPAATGAPGDPGDPAATGTPGDPGSPDGPDNGTVSRKKRYLDEFHNSINETFTEEEEVWLDPTETGATDIVYALGKQFTAAYMDIPRDARHFFGHQLGNMLLQCNFAGRRCYPSNFTNFQSSKYGNCFTLDSSKFIAKRSGPDYGVSMVLYLQTFEYIPGITTGYGLRVHLHHPSSIPFPAASGIFVQAAQETNIAVKQKRIKRLGDPYGICEKGDNFKKLHKKEYNIQSCQYTCKAQQIMERCNCYDEFDESDFSLPEGVKKKACKTSEEMNCLREVIKLSLTKKLQCTCPDPCQETAYISTITSREWPTSDYAILLRESVCEKHPEDCEKLKAMKEADLARNFLNLKIYYADLNYEVVAQSPDIQPSQFASDLGGAIGLWIGLSMLSVFELVQFVVEIVQFLTSKITKKERSDKKANSIEQELEPRMEKSDISFAEHHDGKNDNFPNSNRYRNYFTNS